MHNGSVSRSLHLLAACGVGPVSGQLPSSTKRFPDDVAFRIEIPSVEGPRCVEAAIRAACDMGVPVRRLSQGSGVGLLTNGELEEMAAAAADAGVEVSLFARPCAAWGISPATWASAGGAFAATLRGSEQLAAAVAEIQRAAEHGFRSVLVSDIGLLHVFSKLRAAGDLPSTMQAKASVMLGISNPATARVLADLGADTLNVCPDLDLSQLAAIRAAVDLPLDMYVEAPDNIGGFVRLYELAEIVRVAAPVYLKFGLRNAPDIYPSGTHLESLAVSLTTERVRRARIGMETLERNGCELTTSMPGAMGLAVPTTPAASDGVRAGGA